jgi:hypothetical protein
LQTNAGANPQKLKRLQIDLSVNARARYARDVSGRSGPNAVLSLVRFVDESLEPWYVIREWETLWPQRAHCQQHDWFPQHRLSFM